MTQFAKFDAAVKSLRAKGFSVDVTTSGGTVEDLVTVTREASVDSGRGFFIFACRSTHYNQSQEYFQRNARLFKKTATPQNV